ncbi:hypothetical protein [Corynebacterium efficiens]|uniref:hypothetical protein n=1 Tax=Corynebacterium efficiens TaxID=152794 RepID=UPI001E3316EA|nr:hypothetical protein [Corynebacterium efficiens]
MSTKRGAGPISIQTIANNLGINCNILQAALKNTARARTDLTAEIPLLNYFGGSRGMVLGGTLTGQVS